MFDNYFKYDLEEQVYGLNSDEDDVFSANFMKIKILYNLDLIERWAIFRYEDHMLDISVFFKLFIFHIDRFYGSTQHYNINTWSYVKVKVAENRKDYNNEELIGMCNAFSIIKLNFDNAAKTFINALANMQNKIIEKKSEIK